GNLLEAAQQRGLLEVGRDEKSGTYVFRSHGADESDAVADRGDEQAGVGMDPSLAQRAADVARPAASDVGQPEPSQAEGRRKGRGGRQNGASGGSRRAEPRQTEPPAADKPSRVEASQDQPDSAAMES